MLALLLLVQFASTLFMVGLIWFVQVVHYPLMAEVGRESSGAYARSHQERTTWVVAGPMFVELLTAVGILIVSPIMRASPTYLVATALLAVAWLATVLLMIPLHQSLLGGTDARAIRRLVGLNWIRTFAWTARGVLIGWIVWRTFDITA